MVINDPIDDERPAAHSLSDSVGRNASKPHRDNKTDKVAVSVTERLEAHCLGLGCSEVAGFVDAKQGKRLRPAGTPDGFLSDALTPPRHSAIEVGRASVCEPVEDTSAADLEFCHEFSGDLIFGGGLNFHVGEL
jgi:hypothetical protein